MSADVKLMEPYTVDDYRYFKEALKTGYSLEEELGLYIEIPDYSEADEQEQS